MSDDKEWNGRGRAIIIIVIIEIDYGLRREFEWFVHLEMVFAMS